MNPQERGRGEQSPSREIIVPLPDVITISGYSGVGKTSVAHILKRLLHMRFEKTGGEKFRSWYERTTGQKMTGFVDRDPSVDKALDEYTTSRIANAIKTGRKAIIEARLGGWLAKGVEDAIASTKKPEEPEGPRHAFRILLTASDGVRFFRIRNREEENQTSFKEVERRTKEREKKDLAIWQVAHPALVGIDPLNEVNMDEKGEQIYDLIVNTDNLSVIQVADKICRELQARGLLIKKPQKQEPNLSSPQLPPSGTIFEAF